MLQLVNVGHKSLADYASIASRGLMDEIRRLAEPLQGKRVVHLSATAFGGGVAEINYALVPLMADVGLDVEWRIIHGEDEFFGVTKTIHNALQGDPKGLTQQQEAIFRRYNALNAEEFEDELRLRDRPRPAAGGDDRPLPGLGRALDLALPHRPLDAEPGRARLPRALARALRRGDLPHARVRARATSALRQAVHLAAGDRPADPEEHGAVGRGRGVRRRPVRDPPRAAAADADLALRPVEGPARRDRRVPDGAARRIPDVQLALVGSMAHDDPEGWDYYNRTVAHAAGDPDIFILSQPEQHRLRRGERLPGALGGRDPEVDPRGLRPDRDRGALEGEADDRRAGRAGSARRSGTARPVGSSTRSRSAPTRAARSSTTRPRRRPAGGAGRRTCASGS